MNEKYQKYIDYIVDDIEAPYYENMRDRYGLDGKIEFRLVLSRVFNQPVQYMGGTGTYDKQGNMIYYEGLENSDDEGYWEKRKFNELNDLIYTEDSLGQWEKHEYDANGYLTYREMSNGTWAKYEYSEQGKLNYYENSRGVIENRR